MSQLFDEIMQLVKNDYLTYFWWLVVAGYILAYGLANLLARAGDHNQGTLFSRCRKAWSIAFFLHALATVGIGVIWFVQNLKLASLWSYFSLYIAVAVADLCLGIGLFATRTKYFTFHEPRT